MNRYPCNPGWLTITVLLYTLFAVGSIALLW